MCDLIKEFKEKINSYTKYSFLIKDHARVRANERRLNLNEVIQELIENKTLINVEKQSNIKYLAFYQKKSKPKYAYVIEFAENYIILITLFRVDIKLQKQVNRKIIKWKKKI